MLLPVVGETFRESPLPQVQAHWLSTFSKPKASPSAVGRSESRWSISIFCPSSNFNDDDDSSVASTDVVMEVNEV